MGAWGGGAGEGGGGGGRGGGVSITIAFVPVRSLLPAASSDPTAYRTSFPCVSSDLWLPCIGFPLCLCSASSGVS